LSITLVVSPVVSPWRIAVRAGVRAT
jgi:hypothetical protein